MVKVNFPTWGEHMMFIETYRNNRMAIQFKDDEGMPLMCLTVNMPEDHLEPGEFFVKTWSENMPLIPTLRESGIFIDTLKRIPTGFVHAEVWKFTDDYAHLYKGGV